MYKVIIADDEPVIVNGLKNMMNWAEMNCVLVAEAYNGKEALTYLKTEKPDIAIFDICMPELTGIELIRMINQEKFQTKVIFISGYQDFFYAQQALNAGAMEYLLKPVKKINLEQAIQKAVNSITAQNPISLLQESKNEIQEIFGDINQSDEYAEEELYERFHSLGLDFSEKQLIGACFAISKEDKESLIQDKYEKFELIRFSIFHKIQDYFSTNRTGFVIRREEDSTNMMLLIQKGREDYVMEDLILPVIEGIQKEYRISMFVALGDKIDSISKLKYAYKTARFSYDLKYFENKHTINFKSIKKDYAKSFDDYQRIRDKIMKKVLAGEKGVKNDIEICLHIIESLHYGNRYAAVNRCFAFTIHFFQVLSEYQLLDESYREKQEAFMKQIQEKETFFEVKQDFILFYQELIDEILDETKNKDKLIVANMKEYINTHYEQDLSLNHMAKLYYMNSFYFSSFFKKETGENFKDYLTEIRMKEAIKLILTTDMKTYEIAEKAGYHNVRRFTDKFRELYGISPSDYKKSKMNKSI